MDKSELSKPQPMDGVDQEKVFLKKLESTKVANIRDVNNVGLIKLNIKPPSMDIVEK